MSGGQRKFELSLPQILGGALSAVTAAVAASYLGVAGTVIGAAVVSVASTVATAVYTHYLAQTGERVKQHAPRRPRRESEDRAGEVPDEEKEPADGGESTLVMPSVRDRRPSWIKLGAAAAIVFGVSMGSILVYQAIAQQTVHEQVTGKTPAKAQREEERPAPRQDEQRPESPADPIPQSATYGPQTPEPSVTPTPTRTPTARPTPTPTSTPTPTDEVKPSEEATSSPPAQEEQQPGVTEEPPATTAEPTPPPVSTEGREELGGTP